MGRSARPEQGCRLAYALTCRSVRPACPIRGRSPEQLFLKKLSMHHHLRARGYLAASLIGCYVDSRPRSPPPHGASVCSQSPSTERPLNSQSESAAYTKWLDNARTMPACLTADLDYGKMQAWCISATRQIGSDWLVEDSPAVSFESWCMPLFWGR